MKHRDLPGTLTSIHHSSETHSPPRGAFLKMDEPWSNKGLATTLAFFSSSVACEDAVSVEDGNHVQQSRLGATLAKGAAG